MHARIMNAALCVLLASAAAVAHVQTLDDSLAERFMPPVFVAAVARGEFRSDERHWRVLPIDLDHTGRKDYLAVVYGENTLRLLRRGRTPSLVGESSDPIGCDSTATIDAIDIDDDGRPELEYVCRAGNRGKQYSSFFKWTGAALENINPAGADDHDAIEQPNPVDLDGNGVLGFLSASCPFTVDQDGVLHQCWAIYRLLNGRLAKCPGPDVTLFELYRRGKGKRSSEQKKFSALPGAYTLMIVNGERGQRMATGAVITLNGIVVTPATVLAKKPRKVLLDVTLAATNNLSVELRGQQKSQIYVLLTLKH